MRGLRVILYICFAAAVGLIGWLVPVYLSAVDVAVLKEHGRKGPPLEDLAAQLLQNNHLGQADLLLLAVERTNSPPPARLQQLISLYKQSHPQFIRYGGKAFYLQEIEKRVYGGLPTSEASVVQVLLPSSVRRMALHLLRDSRDTTVIEILKNRYINHTTIFPPATSDSGQALDTAILIMALLAEENQLHPRFREQVEKLAAAANQGKFTGPLEAVYLDLLTLSRFLNWDQLAGWIRRIPTTGDLREIVYRVLRSSHREQTAAVLFTATTIAGEASILTEFLRKFPEQGLQYLEDAVLWGGGAVERLLRVQHRPYLPPYRAQLLQWKLFRDLFDWFVQWAVQARWLVLLLKCWIWFNAAFLFCRGISLLIQSRPLEQVPGMFVVRLQRQLVGTALLFGLVLLLTEPYLGQAQEVLPAPKGWEFPKLKLEITQKIEESEQLAMNNQFSWVALAVFFGVQLALYILSLIKLREIKRQPHPPEVKLRLLDNEEHMFDAGLYVGLGGTIGSLVLFTLNIYNVGYVVAYSSTLFGIFFVSLLKICHVRPYRRSLIIQQSKPSEQVQVGSL